MKCVLSYKYIPFLVCVLLFFSSFKGERKESGQPLKVMTFNIRLDVPSDSTNNWKYRKDNVYKMISCSLLCCLFYFKCMLM